MSRYLTPLEMKGSGQEHLKFSDFLTLFAKNLTFLHGDRTFTVKQLPILGKCKSNFWPENNILPRAFPLFPRPS